MFLLILVLSVLLYTTRGADDCPLQGSSIPGADLQLYLENCNDNSQLFVDGPLVNANITLVGCSFSIIVLNSIVNSTVTIIGSILGSITAPGAGVFVNGDITQGSIILVSASFMSATIVTPPSGSGALFIIAGSVSNSSVEFDGVMFNAQSSSQGIVSSFVYAQQLDDGSSLTLSNCVLSLSGGPLLNSGINVSAGIVAASSVLIIDSTIRLSPSLSTVPFTLLWIGGVLFSGSNVSVSHCSTSIQQQQPNDAPVDPDCAVVVPNVTNPASDAPSFISLEANNWTSNRYASTLLSVQGVILEGPRVEVRGNVLQGMGTNVSQLMLVSTIGTSAPWVAANVRIEVNAVHGGPSSAQAIVFQAGPIIDGSTVSVAGNNASMSSSLCDAVILVQANSASAAVQSSLLSIVNNSIVCTALPVAGNSTVVAVNAPLSAFSTVTVEGNTVIVGIEETLNGGGFVVAMRFCGDTPSSMLTLSANRIVIGGGSSIGSRGIELFSLGSSVSAAAGMGYTFVNNNTVWITGAATGSSGIVLESPISSWSVSFNNVTLLSASPGAVGIRLPGVPNAVQLVVSQNTITVTAAPLTASQATQGSTVVGCAIDIVPSSTLTTASTSSMLVGMNDVTLEFPSVAFQDAQGYSVVCVNVAIYSLLTLTGNILTAFVPAHTTYYPNAFTFLGPVYPSAVGEAVTWSISNNVGALTEGTVPFVYTVAFDATQITSQAAIAVTFTGNNFNAARFFAFNVSLASQLSATSQCDYLDDSLVQPAPPDGVTSVLNCDSPPLPSLAPVAPGATVPTPVPPWVPTPAPITPVPTPAPLPSANRSGDAGATLLSGPSYGVSDPIKVVIDGCDNLGLLFFSGAIVGASISITDCVADELLFDGDVGESTIIVQRGSLGGVTFTGSFTNMSTFISSASLVSTNGDALFSFAGVLTNSSSITVTAVVGSSVLFSDTGLGVAIPFPLPAMDSSVTFNIWSLNITASTAGPFQLASLPNGNLEGQRVSIMGNTIHAHISGATASLLALCNASINSSITIAGNSVDWQTGNSAGDALLTLEAVSGLIADVHENLVTSSSASCALIRVATSAGSGLVILLRNNTLATSAAMEAALVTLPAVVSQPVNISILANVLLCAPFFTAAATAAQASNVTLIQYSGSMLSLAAGSLVNITFNSITAEGSLLECSIFPLGAATTALLNESATFVASFNTMSCTGILRPEAASWNFSNWVLDGESHLVVMGNALYFTSAPECTASMQGLVVALLMTYHGSCAVVSQNTVVVDGSGAATCTAISFVAPLRNDTCIDGSGNTAVVRNASGESRALRVSWAADPAAALGSVPVLARFTDCTAEAECVTPGSCLALQLTIPVECEEISFVATSTSIDTLSVPSAANITVFGNGSFTIQHATAAVVSAATSNSAALVPIIFINAAFLDAQSLSITSLTISAQSSMPNAPDALLSYAGLGVSGSIARLNITDISIAGFDATGAEQPIGVAFVAWTTVAFSFFSSEDNDLFATRLAVLHGFGAATSRCDILEGAPVTRANFTDGAVLECTLISVTETISETDTLTRTVSAETITASAATRTGVSTVTATQTAVTLTATQTVENSRSLVLSATSTATYSAHTSTHTMTVSPSVTLPPRSTEAPSETAIGTPVSKPAEPTNITTGAPPAASQTTVAPPAPTALQPALDALLYVLFVVLSGSLYGPLLLNATLRGELAAAVATDLSTLLGVARDEVRIVGMVTGSLIVTANVTSQSGGNVTSKSLVAQAVAAANQQMQIARNRAVGAFPAVQALYTYQTGNTAAIQLLNWSIDVPVEPTAVPAPQGLNESCDALCIGLTSVSSIAILVLAVGLLIYIRSVRLKWWVERYSSDDSHTSKDHPEEVIAGGQHDDHELTPVAPVGASLCLPPPVMRPSSLAAGAKPQLRRHLDEIDSLLAHEVKQTLVEPRYDVPVSPFRKAVVGDDAAASESSSRRSTPDACAATARGMMAVPRPTDKEETEPLQQLALPPDSGTHSPPEDARPGTPELVCEASLAVAAIASSNDKVQNIKPAFPPTSAPSLKPPKHADPAAGFISLDS